MRYEKIKEHIKLRKYHKAKKHKKHKK